MNMYGIRCGFTSEMPRPVALGRAMIGHMLNFDRPGPVQVSEVEVAVAKSVKNAVPIVLSEGSVKASFTFCLRLNCGLPLTICCRVHDLLRSGTVS